MMANSEHVEFKSSLVCEENEATQPLRELSTFTQTVEGRLWKCIYIFFANYLSNPSPNPEPH